MFAPFARQTLALRSAIIHAADTFPPHSFRQAQRSVRLGGSIDNEMRIPAFRFA